MKHICGIYLIRNKVNGNQYIGSSINITGRLSGHFKALAKGCHKNIHFQRAFEKYGLDNFESKILLICDKNILIYFEQKCIDFLKPEYNICHIVGPGFFRGCRYSEESRKKLSIARLGNKNSLGYVHTSETRKKMSISGLGRKPSSETRVKLSISKLGNKGPLGTKRSDETKSKMSTSKFGNSWNIGRKHSEETIRKRVESYRLTMSKRKQNES
jgi:group I intron endonuclease